MEGPWEVQPPAQSWVSSEVKPGSSGLYPAWSCQPPRRGAAQPCRVPDPAPHRPHGEEAFPPPGWHLPHFYLLLLLLLTRCDEPGSGSSMAAFLQLLRSRRAPLTPTRSYRALSPAACPPGPAPQALAGPRHGRSPRWELQRVEAGPRRCPPAPRRWGCGGTAGGPGRGPGALLGTVVARHPRGAAEPHP